jgi:hypothetical protein
LEGSLVAATNELDPRWLKLQDSDWTCPSCGEAHRGLFDLACTRPDFWRGNEEKRPNAELDLTSSFLSEDFCVLDGRHFFVRCVLQLPILATGGAFFGFGVWSTLSRKNLEIYIDTFDSGDQADLGPWFGWFSNKLNGYPDTLNLKCQVRPQAGRQRPLIELDLTDHPLAQDQQNGVTFDRLLEIYAANGHDIRDAIGR